MTTIVYEITIWKSPASWSILAPSIVSHVEFIVVSIRGRRSGNDRTGYKVPFEFALDISAAMIVSTEESPILPITVTSINKQGLFISRPVIRTNKMTMNRLIENERAVLNISLPRKTDLDEEESFSASEVPRSSSATNTRESPFELAKNIIIHSRPA